MDPECKELQLEVDSVQWVNDKGLWESFQRENAMPEGLRLSYRAGNGLY
jgi:hypothetical protein